VLNYCAQFQHLQGKWAGFKQFSIDDNNVDTWKAEWSPDTGFDVEKLRQIGLTTCSAKTIEVHRLLQRYFQGRKQKLEAGSGIDWPTAEALAVGSLVVEGHDVRLSGQDTGRGTFSHRHWKLWDQTPTEFDGETGVKYEMPLNNLQSKQGRVTSVNSLLSEQAVLGFGKLT
jgi:2-oxoglutarate dehydrogenase E1 component